MSSKRASVLGPNRKTISEEFRAAGIVSANHVPAMCQALCQALSGVFTRPFAGLTEVPRRLLGRDSGRGHECGRAFAQGDLCRDGTTPSRAADRR